MSRLDLAHKLINCALAVIEQMPRTREMALVRTKLQEALLWLIQYEGTNDAQG